MKRDYYRFDQNAELSPDLEWMLQSRQVSLHLLLESLTADYYAPLYRLTLSILNDARAARQSVQEVFLKAALGLHRYRSDIGVDAWIYRIAWRVIERARRREQIWAGIEKVLHLTGELTEKVSSKPANQADQDIWQSVDELREPDRSLVLLHCANTWSEEQIAKVTGIPKPAISKQISSSLDKIARKSDLGREDAKSAVAMSLQTRWPLLQPDDEEISAVRAQIEQRVGTRNGFRPRLAVLKEMAIIGFAILLVALIIWGGNRFLLEPAMSSEPAGANPEGSQLAPGSASSRQPPGTAASGGVSSADASAPRRTPTSIPTVTPTPAGIFYYVQEGETLASIADRLGVSEADLLSFNRLPGSAEIAVGKPLVIPGAIALSAPSAATPVSPFVRRSAPDEIVSSAEVLALLNPEVYQFHTVWLDTQIIRYPQGDRSAAPEVYRAQMWLSQQQLLIIAGPEGSEPYEVGIGTGRRFYYAQPGENRYWFHNYSRRWTGETISVPVLYGLMALFGDLDENPGSSFEVIGESRQADRDAWVVNQANSAHDRLALLWIDKETGLILRSEQLTAPRMLPKAGEYLPSEVNVQAIQYDVDFPQELFNYSLPWRGGFARDFTGQPETGRGSERLVGQSAVEESDVRRTPPSDFSVAKSRLSFSYPIEASLMPSLSGTNIYADGYYLGRINMGIPWETACQRSSDGEVLVLGISPEDDGEPISVSGGHHYVRLENPEEVVRLLPAGSISSRDFAISPDSRYVAFWGCERRGAPCGLYVFNLKDERRQMLVEIAKRTEEFTWSPDGKFIAMVVDQEMLTIVRAADGEVIAENLYDPRRAELPIESAVYSWGVKFPPQDTGLESCVLPPG